MVGAEQLNQLNIVGVEVPSSPAKIVSGYADILYDDGPLLWHGRNAAGQRVVGSDLWWHRETRTGYCIEAIVPDDLFLQWAVQMMTYPDLLRSSDVYLEIYTAADKVTRYRKVRFDDLPEGVRPMEHAMCDDDFDPDYMDEPSGFT